MTLDEYLAQPGMTATQLAQAANSSSASISRILYGEMQPSADTMRAIVEATGGRVTADDLLFGKPRAKPERAA